MLPLIPYNISIFGMIEPFANVPSNEEISFKLTENLIPSIANSHNTFLPLQCSLDYTHSQVSIQEMLQDDCQHHDWNTGAGSSFIKNSSIKVSSLNATNDSSLKTSRMFRERTISSGKITIKPEYQRRFSFQLFEFDPEKITPKTTLIHNENQRCWSERRRRSKMAQKKENPIISNTSYVQQGRKSSPRIWKEENNSLVSMRTTMQILQIKLKTDQRREKSYLKRVLQSRVCNVHAAQEKRTIWRSGRDIKF